MKSLLKLAKLQDKFDKEVFETDDLEIQIQNGFVKFKKAEQDFFELLSKVKDEEQLIKITGKLKEMDNQIKLIKVTKSQPSYVG
jgi:hypothetical protein